MTWFEKLRQKKAWCPAIAQSMNGGKTSVDPVITSGMTGSPVARRAKLFMYLAWAVVGLGFLSAYLALPYLPATMATHWDILGNSDGFNSRIVGAFGNPVIMTALMILFTGLPRFEGMKGTFSLYRDIYAILIFCVTVFMLGVHLFVLLTAMGTVIPISVFMPMMQGILFIVLGSLLPHVGRSTTMGFRLPWTLRDPVVWQQTHEYGSSVIIAAGALNLVCPLAGDYAFLLGMGIILAAMGYVTAWSYRLARSRAAGLRGQCP